MKRVPLGAISALILSLVIVLNNFSHLVELWTYSYFSLINEAKRRIEERQVPYTYIFFIRGAAITRNMSKEDTNALLKWYRQSAENGDGFSAWYVGNMYYDGLVIQKDYSKSASWYRIGAEKGDPYSQFLLANMYKNGQGVRIDFSEAAKWYRLAALEGEHDAQYQLGLMYAAGEGVPLNLREAYMWLDIANWQSGEIKEKDIVAGKMSLQEFEEIQKKVGKCDPLSRQAESFRNAKRIYELCWIED